MLEIKRHVKRQLNVNVRNYHDQTLNGGSDMREKLNSVQATRFVIRKLKPLTLFQNFKTVRILRSVLERTIF